MKDKLITAVIAAAVFGVFYIAGQRVIGTLNHTRSHDVVIDRQQVRLDKELSDLREQTDDLQRTTDDLKQNNSQLHATVSKLQDNVRRQNLWIDAHFRADRAIREARQGEKHK